MFACCRCCEAKSYTYCLWQCPVLLGMIKKPIFGQVVQSNDKVRLPHYLIQACFFNAYAVEDASRLAGKLSFVILNLSFEIY